jgi:S1-C subfamily serine protease
MNYILLTPLYAASLRAEQSSSRLNEPDMNNAVIAKVAMATVKFVKLSELKRDRSGNIITQGAKTGGCPDKGIAQQGSPPDPGGCSGVLVKPNVIVTAAHCVSSGMCSDTGFIFNLQTSKEKVPESELYKCKRVIAVKRSGHDDIAAIELTGLVNGIEPIPIRRSSKPAVGTSMTLLGYPAPLQMKTSTGTLKSIGSSTGTLMTDAFTEAGMSGGPVVNQDGLLEGVVSGLRRQTKVTPLDAQSFDDLKNQVGRHKKIPPEVDCGGVRYRYEANEDLRIGEVQSDKDKRMIPFGQIVSPITLLAAEIDRVSAPTPTQPIPSSTAQ